MNLLKRLLGKQSVDDEPIASQQESFEWWRRAVGEGTGVTPHSLSACDELPGASGPFGESADSPIPVNGPEGEVIYLNQLRCKNGCGFLWHRIGSSTTAGPSKNLDIYELVALDASEWRRLYFSMYHPRRSTLTPAGLHLRSWKSLSDIERVFAKCTGFGSTSYVENFPFGMSDAAARDEQLNSISPGVGASVAKRVQDILRQSEGKWSRPPNFPPS
jgi:hypothetical protein